MELITNTPFSLIYERIKKVLETDYPAKQNSTPSEIEAQQPPKKKQKKTFRRESFLFQHEEPSSATDLDEPAHYIQLPR